MGEQDKMEISAAVDTDANDKDEKRPERGCGDAPSLDYLRKSDPPSGDSYVKKYSDPLYYWKETRDSDNRRRDRSRSRQKGRQNPRNTERKLVDRAERAYLTKLHTQ